MQPTRRGFLLGLGALVAAPAVVRMSSIMPVRVPFDQRMVWSVYGAESARVNTYDTALTVGTADSDINAVMAWRFGPYTRLDRGDALAGMDLQRYEALHLPRMELLRIGDRVVDKRIIGGVIPEVVKGNGVALVNGDLVTRAEIEARHRPSARARRQAADVLARAGLPRAWQ